MNPVRWMAMTTLLALWSVASPLEGQEVVELPPRDRVIRPELETLYSVGALDGADWEIFGSISQVGFDAAGNLYVFDRDNFRVVVVSPEGELVRELGRQGDGPGEWRFPTTMTVLPDGRVAVADMGHRALLVHDVDGEVENTIPLGSDGSITITGFQADPRGGALIEGAGGASFSMSVGGRETGDPPTTRPITRWNLDGAPSRTVVYEGWKPPAEEEEPTTVSGGGVSFRMGVGGPRVFEPRMHVGVLSDGGVAVVDSTTYRVEVVGPDGSFERILHRPFRPDPVTDRVKEAEKDRRLEALEEGEGPQMRVMVSGGGGGSAPVSQDQMKEMMRSRVEQLRFYHEIPVVSAMRAGWGDKLWIRRTDEELGEPGPMDVVSASGDYLGTIPADHLGMPGAFGPDGRVAYIERDEFDVATVVVMELPAELR